MKVKYKLLKWIYLYLRKSLKKAHLEAYGNDMLCPNCKEWFSFSGAIHDHSYEWDEEKELHVCQCGQCGYISYWSPNIAPVLIRTTDKGIPC